MESLTVDGGVSNNCRGGMQKLYSEDAHVGGGVQIGGGRVFGVSHCGGGNRKGGILA